MTDSNEQQAGYYDIRSAAWSLYQRRQTGKPANVHHDIYIHILQLHLDSIRDAARLIDHRSHVVAEAEIVGTRSQIAHAEAALAEAQAAYDRLINPAGRR